LVKGDVSGNETDLGTLSMAAKKVKGGGAGGDRKLSKSFTFSRVLTFYHNAMYHSTGSCDLISLQLPNLRKFTLHI